MMAGSSAGVEHSTDNREAGGSNPPLPTTSKAPVDWITEVRVYQAIKQAMVAIDAAEAAHTENAENINKIRAVQPGSTPCTTLTIPSSQNC